MISILFSITITSCAIFQAPPAPPNIIAPASEISALVIAVDMPVQVWLNNWQGFQPEKVLFIKLDDDRSLFQGELIESNYLCMTGIAERYVLLLNAAPGIYAAVASIGKVGSGAFGKGITTDVTAFFPETFIKESIAEAKAGQMVSMGRHVFNTAGSMNGADVTQLYYYNALTKGERIKGYWEGMVSKSRCVAPTYDASKSKMSNSEILLLEKIREFFANTAWNSLIEKRIGYIKGSLKTEQ